MRLRSCVLDPWLAGLRPRPQPSVRLFCLPCAGGGASAYRDWADFMPSAVEVCPVQLPGRETRFHEPPCADLPQLVGSLARALRPYLDGPFALFGHSMGGLLGFELARRLRADGGPEPAHLFVAGCAAPQLTRTEPPTHTLPDAEFVAELRNLNGTPPAALQNRELMELLLPTLRADFALCETYSYAAGPPLHCPITAFGGLQDGAVPREHLAAWAAQTDGPCRVRMLPGDHFFPQTRRDLLLPALARDLLPAMTPSWPARPDGAHLGTQRPRHAGAALPAWGFES